MQFYIPQQIVQSGTKKVKTADNLFLVSKWKDRSAAIDTVKERVLECLKFVFHKKVENRYYDALFLSLCVHIQLFIETELKLYCCKFQHFSGIIFRQETFWFEKCCTGGKLWGLWILICSLT